jgi:UDP-glucose 4-epimerase
LKVLVTGATGFVGTYLVDHLVKEGVEVVATGRRKDGEEYYKSIGVPFANVDITKIGDFAKLPKDIDAVAHLAGLLSIDMYSPLEYLTINTFGTYNVLEYCRMNDIGKIVFAMTHSHVNQAETTVITEETPEKFSGLISKSTSTPYVISKIAAMKFVESYTGNYGIRGISLRLPGVRGYGSRFISFWDGKPEVNAFQKFITRAMRSEPIEIWGKHETYRDLVYVKDVASGFAKALKSKNAIGLYNVASGVGTTIDEELRAIISAFSPKGKPSKLIYRPDIPEVKRKNAIFSIEKAKQDFGYIANYPYEVAMKDYVEEMNLGRFRYLVAIQEEVLFKKFGKTIEQVLSSHA